MFGNRKRTKFSPSRTKRNGRLYTKRRCVSDETEDIRISSEREMIIRMVLFLRAPSPMRTSTENRFPFFTWKKFSDEFFRSFYFFIEFIYFYVPSFRDTSFRHSDKEKEFLSTTLVGPLEPLCRTRPGRETQNINLGASV